MLAGEPIPEEIVNAPRLFDGLATYLEDYNLLSRYAGADPIRLSEVLAYAEHEGMSEDYTADLLAYIPELENIRIPYLRQKAKEEAEKDK